MDINSYDQNDNSEVIYEIIEEQTYSINTGSLLGSEKAIIGQITRSLKAKLFFEGEWIDMTSKTKKYNDFKDNVHQYGENLTFNVKRNNSFSNLLLPVAEVDEDQVTVGDIVTTSTTILVYFTLINYTGSFIRRVLEKDGVFRYSTLPTTPHYNFGSLDLEPPFLVYFTAPDDPEPISNIVTYNP
ncbi:hypothetical protein [Flavobacterium sp. 3HN19-14]|uniref:hypothetical protein n=1 Tax=Flavobacterium sp. 3HN19-14 TaxID=3448133 RepID=UPI003EE3FFD5